ncbi:NifB/NifX family molybdenum-iron cluster-binding protein [candidate division WOR-3 bacterium]|nr:NifB/NifX family molybdenum-iron cluster-binding protein [candidate division WOR-3 bacterium]
MKIAVPTDDGKRIAEHFGRAQTFAIFEIEDGQIKSKAIIDSRSPHLSGQHGQDHGAWFMSALEGYDVIISRGMGRRAIAYFQEAGIKPVFTDMDDVEEAVRAYGNGTLQECAQPDCGRH